VKSEAEIRKIIKQIEEKHLRCIVCKAIEPEITYDGDLKCRKCGNYPYGSWLEYGAWKALKWVLGEITDKEFYEEVHLEW